jgi:hypothetical protein
MKPDEIKYDQPEKNEARERVLLHAVECLTHYRSESPVITARQFTETLRHACDFLGKHCGMAAAQETLSYKEDFLTMHSRRIGTRSPDQLSVLFLAGPKPSQDVRVLVNLGVLPQNIWAIERDGKTFEKAVDDIRSSGYPVKVYHGNLQEFFEVVPQQFDIVYFDSCKALFDGPPNTFSVLRELFLNQRLSPLSVLISNFAEANVDKKHAAEWGKRIGVWSWWRDDYVLRDLGVKSGETDIPAELREVDSEEHFLNNCAANFPKYFEFVAANIPNYYSEFATRFIMEFAGLLLPWWRVIALPGANREYFREGQELKDAKRAKMQNEETAEKELGPYKFDDSFPTFPRILELASTHLPTTDPMQQELFNHELHGTKLSRAVRDVYFMRHLLDSNLNEYANHHPRACSHTLATFFREFNWFDYDVAPDGNVLGTSPQVNLVTDLLLGLYGYPYHANVRKHLRFKYTARKTPMYSDLFVLDQARYFYDFVPTLPVIGTELEFGHQLVLRTCMDLISRHGQDGYSDLFDGATFHSEVIESLDGFEWPERQESKM